MRLFVALHIPTDVRAALGEFVAGLRAKTGRATRWVETDNIHLTLKFIGEVDTSKRDAIEAALGTVRQPRPVCVTFGGATYVRVPPRIFAVGVLGFGELGAPVALVELAKSIDRALVPLGIPAETRGFIPHLTLARLKSGEDAALLRRAEQGFPQFGSAMYRDFDLMESKLNPKGAQYTRLAAFTFAPDAGTSGAAA